ncbi:MAG TPA: septum formation initiator family protein [Flavobacteriaceae bacterium]|nr:septum formation initiator family protein [Flavobacteriaceae bacterium]
MFKKLKNKKWFRVLSNKYVLILLIFVVWMLFFDTNSWLVHRELDKELNDLENNIEYFKNEISNDKRFLRQLDDSTEMEKFAREQYYLKKENEDIYIIENLDSIKKKDR